MIRCMFFKTEYMTVYAYIYISIYIEREREEREREGFFNRVQCPIVVFLFPIIYRTNWLKLHPKFVHPVVFTPRHQHPLLKRCGRKACPFLSGEIDGWKMKMSFDNP